MATSGSNKEELKEIVEVKNMRDCSNEPFFKKKAESDAAFIKKHGLPKTIRKKKK